MCLAVPAKVVAIDGAFAKVDVEGNIREAGIRLVPDVKVGDYVLVHAGFVVEIVDPQAAEETLAIFREALKAEEGAI
ncbi:MAG: HypC/HybG/HupF family hydrogenase formation chaperone [Bacillota bacterium]|nr:HypC/HybG/HupF family hydrogenase formation chaperone [Bacillota bacterium]